MLLTDETAFCFAAVGLSDGVHDALIRERRQLSQEDFSKANDRFFSWQLREENRLMRAYDERMLEMAETRGMGYEYFENESLSVWDDMLLNADNPDLF